MTEEILIEVRSTVEMMSADQSETPLLKNEAWEKLLLFGDKPLFIELPGGTVVVCVQGMEIYCSGYGMSVNEGSDGRFASIERLTDDWGAYNRDFRVWNSFPSAAHSKRFPWFERQEASDVENG